MGEDQGDESVLPDAADQDATVVPAGAGAADGEPVGDGDRGSVRNDGEGASRPLAQGRSARPPTEEAPTGGSSATDAPSYAPFAVLLRVQDLDTSIAQLRHRKAMLAERIELEAAESRLAELATMRADVDSRRKALVERETAIEHQLDELEKRAKGLEAHLYDARGSASRDLQAMDEGIHHIAQRREELEEQELELLVEQEPIDAELAQIDTEQNELSEAAMGLRAAVAAAEVVVQAELEAVEMQRVLEAGRLPADLSERYEKLRAHLKGVGAARLIGSHCDGCHLELASVEVERIRRLPEDQVVTCDQCGRILVRT